MAYYINLFSPDTYEAFSKSNQTISGFRERQKGIAAEVKLGDKLICYVTKVSRWVGVLEVTSKYFLGNSPIFTPINDPFVVRFNVKPNIWLSLEKSLPVWNEIVWKKLSFTKKLPPDSLAWTGMVRGSLRLLKDTDGEILVKLLSLQNAKQTTYPLSDSEKKKLKTTTVKTQNSKQVTVTIPDNEENKRPKSIPGSRDSIKTQALIAEIGEKMNFKIWLPRSDRQRVLDLWKHNPSTLLEILPLNYDDATLRTIENIDVLWIKGRSIVRAFEVEHTTSIYSGILRMADLMALQPNLSIIAHIVAPIERKEKVLQEISRPVFAFLEKGPLAESCSFLSYDTITELSKEKQLKHMSDSVLEDFAEYAEESDI
jgi:hypothetical protein